MKPTIKGKGTNYKFLPEVQAALKTKKRLTGKTFTAILEDLVLGRSQFSPGVEQFLADEVQRTGRTRDQIIEFALMRLAYSETRQPVRLPSNRSTERRHGAGTGRSHSASSGQKKGSYLP